MDESEWKMLTLNDDEEEHYKQIGGEAERHLALAEAASIITLNGLMSLEEYPRINEVKALVTLLMAKAAKNVRLAIIGLKLGYYAGASAILRSAFESLTFAYLFNSEPSQVATWLRNEFSNRPQSDLSYLRNEQTKEAKKALLELGNEPPIIRDVIGGFLKEANKYTHATLIGLAREFNVDIEYFVPDELASAEDDLDSALDRYVLLSSFGKNILEQDRTDKSEDELLWIQLAGRYDEDTLFNLSAVAFYIAHRLLDMTKAFVIRNKEYDQNYRDWHKAIEELGESGE